MDTEQTGTFEVSKLDAVRRQLDTAIGLYFDERDPVSIHTLAAAAYDVLRGVNSKRGGSPMALKERMLNYVRKEHIPKVRRALNEAQNFFKHADRDHDQLLSFNPGLSEVMLWDCCMKYHELSGEHTSYTEAFFAYFTLKHPDVYTLPEFMQGLLSGAWELMKHLSKRDFIQSFMTAKCHADPKAIARRTAAFRTLFTATQNGGGGASDEADDHA